MMTWKTKVDGVDIYTEYGVYITSGGWNSLVAMPPLKTPDSNDWQEEDGTEVDLSSPVLDTREVTVSFACAPDASRIADFISLLSDGAYHKFECLWIGRTYTLRMVSQSKLSYSPALGTFSLKLADDFPLDGYEYAAPDSTMSPHYDYLIDGTPLTDYGVRVLSGTLSNVLSMPAVKTALLRNVSVLSGAEYDGAAVTFGSKDVKVQCLMRAETLEGLWRNWNALLYDLARPGERTLYCADAGRTFPCWYKSCSVSSFSPGERPWLQFALTLAFTYDTHMDDVVFRIVPTPSDARVTVNGREVTFVRVTPGTSVSWSVSKEGYVTASGSQTVTGDTVLPVELEMETYTVTFRVSPADVAVTVNGTAYTPDSGGEVAVYAQWGDVLEWSVTRDGYSSKTGTLTVEVALVEAGKIISGITYDDIPAGGGTVLPKIAAVDGAVLTYSGEGVNTSTGAVSADSLGTEVTERAKVTTVTVTATYGGLSVIAHCDVYQQANVVERTDTVSETYGTPAVSLSYGDDIPAWGGTVTPTLSYSQTVTGTYTDTYTSGATATRDGYRDITSGATVAYSGTGVDASTGAVSADSLGITEKARTKVATATVTVTMNGQSNSKEADVYQAENKVESESSETTYSVPAVSLSYEVDGVEGADIPAGGGTANPVLSYSQTKTTGHSYTYSSGEVWSPDGETETITSGGTATYSGMGVDTSTGTVSADSLGTTVKSRSSVATATVTVTMNGKENSADCAVYQQENKVETTSDEDVYSDVTITGGHTYDDISAGGGTVTPTAPTYEQTHTWGHTEIYTSGATASDGGSETLTSGATVAYSGTGVDASTGAVSADSLGITEKARAKVATATVTVTMNGQSNSKEADVYQAENKVESESSETTYSVPAVSLSYEVDGVEGADIPAGGGTANPVLSYSQTKTTGHSYTYSSGEVWSPDGETETIENTGGTITYSGDGVASDGTVSWMSLGTTVKARTKVATATVTVTMNGKENSADCAVYQQENKVEKTEESVSYGAVEVTAFSYEDISAAGGTVYPNLSYRQEAFLVTTRTYTSGAMDSENGDTYYVTDGAETTYSFTTYVEGTTRGRTGGGVEGYSLGTTETERTRIAAVTVTVEFNGSTATAATSVYQEANVIVSSTTERERERLEINVFSYPDVPAEGGTVYPDVEFYYYYTNEYIYTYTSGETKTEEDTESSVRVTESDGLTAEYTMETGSLIAELPGGAFTWEDAAESLERTLLNTVTCNARYVSPYSGEELTAAATADVYQEPREAWLRVDPDSLAFTADGGNASVSVDSSADWWVEDVSDDWLGANPAIKTGTSVSVSASANTSANARTGAVTLANEDGRTAEVAVTQEAAVGEVTHTLTVDIQTNVLSQTGGVTGTPTLRLTCGGETVTALLMTVSAGKEWQGSGEYKHGSEVSYEVTMDGYTTVTGSVTMDDDKTVNVTLRASSSGGGLLG